MRRALALCSLLAGCLGTRAFPCDSDADCSGGGGRCEPEGVCSFLDPSCASERRFAEHAGSLSGTCTTPIPPRPLRNACVAGERWPTRDDTCAASVCDVVPSCCEVTWGEPCVLLAGQLCPDVACGRWIAAVNETTTELLTWNGSDYAARGTFPGGGRVAWVDARDVQPRLAIGRTSAVAVYSPTGTDLMPGYELAFSFNNTSTSAIRAITAIDSNADDIVEVGLAYAGAAPHLALVEPGGMSSPIPGPATESMAWADYNGDRVPDLAIGTASDYRLLYAVAGGYELAFINIQNIGAFPSVGWGDVDGDGVLDLVAVGAAVTVHLADGENISAMFSASRRSPLSQLAVGVVGDLDGDRRADVVAAVAVGQAGAGLLVYSSFDASAAEGFTGVYAAQGMIPRMHQVALADVDGDRKLDVLGVGETGLVWLRNTSSAGAVSLDAPRPITAAGTPLWLGATGWAPRP